MYIYTYLLLTVKFNKFSEKCLAHASIIYYICHTLSLTTPTSVLDILFFLRPFLRRTIKFDGSINNVLLLTP